LTADGGGDAEFLDDSEELLDGVEEREEEAGVDERGDDSAIVPGKEDLVVYPLSVSCVFDVRCRYSACHCDLDWQDTRSRMRHGRPHASTDALRVRS
jgi:hypothetical protein